MISALCFSFAIASVGPNTLPPQGRAFGTSAQTARLTAVQRAQTFKSLWPNFSGTPKLSNPFVLTPREPYSAGKGYLDLISFMEVRSQGNFAAGLPHGDTSGLSATGASAHAIILEPVPGKVYMATFYIRSKEKQSFAIRDAITQDVAAPAGYSALSVVFLRKPDAKDVCAVVLRPKEAPFWLYAVEISRAD